MRGAAGVGKWVVGTALSPTLAVRALKPQGIARFSHCESDKKGRSRHPSKRRDALPALAVRIVIVPLRSIQLLKPSVSADGRTYILLVFLSVHHHRWRAGGDYRLLATTNYKQHVKRRYLDNSEACVDRGRHCGSSALGWRLRSTTKRQPRQRSCDRLWGAPVGQQAGKPAAPGAAGACPGPCRRSARHAEGAAMRPMARLGIDALHRVFGQAAGLTGTERKRGVLPASGIPAAIVGAVTPGEGCEEIKGSTPCTAFCLQACAPLFRISYRTGSEPRYSSAR